MQEVSSKYIVDLVIIITLIFSIGAGLLIYFVLLYNKRKKKHFEEKEQLKQLVLQTQLEIQEQTLQNISQEIHDNTSQLLGLIKLNLATAKAADEKGQQKITDAHELTGQVINSIRQMSHTLDTGFVARLGLPEAIKYQLELVQKTGEYTATLDVQGAEQKTDPQKELILFRMVQESLNNIIKHAKASEIKVVLEYSTEQLSITISDNGAGFEQSAGKSDGIGLQNMHNRAKLIGAELNIQSELNKGTNTTILLPVA